MNVHFDVCRETGPPVKPHRKYDPALIAQFYLLTRSRKYLIRLKVLAKYGQADIREQALQELKRMEAYPLNGRLAWEDKGEEPKDNNNVD